MARGEVEIRWREERPSLTSRACGGKKKREADLEGWVRRHFPAERVLKDGKDPTGGECAFSVGDVGGGEGILSVYGRYIYASSSGLLSGPEPVDEKNGKALLRGEDGAGAKVGGTGGGVCMATYEVPPEDCGSESGVCGEVEGFCEVGCEGASGTDPWGWGVGEGVETGKTPREEEGG